jgi:hypothetical protein
MTVGVATLQSNDMATVEGGFCFEDEMADF